MTNNNEKTTSLRVYQIGFHYEQPTPGFARVVANTEEEARQTILELGNTVKNIKITSLLDVTDLPENADMIAEQSMLDAAMSAAVDAELANYPDDNVATPPPLTFKKTIQ